MRKLISIIIVMLILSSTQSVAQESVNDLRSRETLYKKLEAFIRRNPDYRGLAATDLPQTIFDDEEYARQWSPIAFGDANGDSVLDLAAIVVKKRNSRTLFSLICFNGSRRGYVSNPIWVIVDSEEQILSTKILSKPPALAAWFCSNCDMASVFRWDGRKYQGGATTLTKDMTNNDKTRVSPEIQREIVEQMIRDGELQQQCVTEAGGYEKAVNVEPNDYNRDGVPELYVSGGYCGMGARREFNWIYRSTERGYKLIFSLVGEVRVLNSRTNGYIDLHSVEFSGPDTYYEIIYQFDGQRYQAVKCKECVYKETSRPTNRCKPIKCR